REEVAKHSSDDDLWVIIDANVYNISRFKRFHPGGLSVLLDPDVAGQDATEAFYSLHRHEVLERPAYQRLKIGTIAGEQSVIRWRVPGAISKVPYGEPTWLTDGYFSPYFSDKHRAFQKKIRQFMDTVVLPDALEREADGKRPSQSVFDKMAYVLDSVLSLFFLDSFTEKLNCMLCVWALESTFKAVS
ncbi:hypothetical protein MLD55_19105, partial [Alcanivorax sp. MM125-6]|nr:hypothetical protein [Alcanivorax sp. MM125-6]